MTEWREDVLGDEFECTDLELGEDAEGPLVATLVRALPERRGFWDQTFGDPRMLEDVDVLYVHGWNDYFFQKHLARFYTERGARFFALDLRKYGRSLRDGLTAGYVDHLADYDDEIGQALAIIRDQDQHASHASWWQRRDPQPFRRLLLLGHSTGGLVLSLWAGRHSGVADALLLNSPWLELQLSSVARKALAPVVGIRAKLSPHVVALPQIDLGFYWQALRECCSEDEFSIINHAWRLEKSPIVRAGWLSTVLEGHTTINAGIDVTVPVCVLLSARSHFGLSWDDAMLRADTVLEVDGVAKSALKLGSSVTVERVDGALHDVFLSHPDARADAFARMERWLIGWNAVAHSPLVRSSSPTAEPVGSLDNNEGDPEHG